MSDRLISAAREASNRLEAWADTARIVHLRLFDNDPECAKQRNMEENLRAVVSILQAAIKEAADTQ